MSHTSDKLYYVKSSDVPRNRPGATPVNRAWNMHASGNALRLGVREEGRTRPGGEGSGRVLEGARPRAGGVLETVRHAGRGLERLERLETVARLDVGEEVSRGLTWFHFPRGTLRGTLFHAMFHEIVASR